jgi:hypothetical protein
LLLDYYSGQFIVSVADTNAEFFIEIDGVDQGLETSHIFYGGGSSFRQIFNVSLLSQQVLSAGSHTINVIGNRYNTGSVTYNYQVSSSTTARRGRMTVMEIPQ